MEKITKKNVNLKINRIVQRLEYLKKLVENNGSEISILKKLNKAKLDLHDLISDIIQNYGIEKE